jgi:hypothetical protein
MEWIPSLLPAFILPFQVLSLFHRFYFASTADVKFLSRSNCVDGMLLEVLLWSLFYTVSIGITEARTTKTVSSYSTLSRQYENKTN